MSAREHIIPVFVPHLGCPKQCVFCNQRRISGRQQPADAAAVHQAMAEAAALPRQGEKRQLAFYGGSFTAIPVSQQLSLLEAARAYRDRGELNSIRLSTRPDAIDDEVLTRLRAYGVETIELGAQSLCDEVLHLSGRGHTAEEVENASGKIKAAGFRLVLQMMTGLPGDSLQRSRETAEKIIALRPDAVRIYPTVIVKDTPLFDLWQQGLYREHTVEEAVCYCAGLLPLFEKAGIPVIRLGLNPTEELSSGAAVGGAYHPALGELVKSRILFQRACALLVDVEPGSQVTLWVHPSRLSQMKGQHCCNEKALRERFSLKSLAVKSREQDKDEISRSLD